MPISLRQRFGIFPCETGNTDPTSFLTKKGVSFVCYLSSFWSRVAKENPFSDCHHRGPDKNPNFSGRSKSPAQIYHTPKIFSPFSLFQHRSRLGDSSELSEPTLIKRTLYRKRDCLHVFFQWKVCAYIPYYWRENYKIEQNDLLTECRTHFCKWTWKRVVNRPVRVGICFSPVSLSPIIWKWARSLFPEWSNARSRGEYFRFDKNTTGDFNDHHRTFRDFNEARGMFVMFEEPYQISAATVFPCFIFEFVFLSIGSE